MIIINGISYIIKKSRHREHKIYKSKWIKFLKFIWNSVQSRHMIAIQFIISDVDNQNIDTDDFWRTWTAGFKLFFRTNAYT